MRDGARRIIRVGDGESEARQEKPRRRALGFSSLFSTSGEWHAVLYTVVLYLFLGHKPRLFFFLPPATVPRPRRARTSCQSPVSDDRPGSGTGPALMMLFGMDLVRTVGSQVGELAHMITGVPPLARTGGFVLVSYDDGITSTVAANALQPVSSIGLPRCKGDLQGNIQSMLCERCRSRAECVELSSFLTHVQWRSTPHCEEVAGRPLVNCHIRH